MMMQTTSVPPMADILSLSKARKAKARAAKEQTAAEHRTLFGRTKTQKARDAAEKSSVAKTIEAHKRTD